MSYPPPVPPTGCPPNASTPAFGFQPPPPLGQVPAPPYPVTPGPYPLSSNAACYPPPLNQSSYPSYTPGVMPTYIPQPYPTSAYAGASYPSAAAPVSGYPHPSTMGPQGTASVAHHSHGHEGITNYVEVPTLRPAVPFDASSDAASLRKAMKGFGTEEKALIRILGHRTSNQRQEIMSKYNQTGRDMKKDLKKELHGDFEDVMIALLLPLPSFLAREVHTAMHGLGTNERTLVDVLCTRNNASIREIKMAYNKEYGQDLDTMIRKETSGTFGKLLVAICAANRDEHNLDASVAPALAKQLYDAGEKKRGTKEEDFIRILSSYSFPVLRCVFQEYLKIAGHTFGKAIEKEFFGDTENGMLALYESIENRPAFYASQLHEAMRGRGTQDKALIRIIVSRCEIDLANIKQHYYSSFNRPLESAIKSDTSGYYSDILLALTGE